MYKTDKLIQILQDGQRVTVADTVKMGLGRHCIENVKERFKKMNWKLCSELDYSNPKHPTKIYWAERDVEYKSEFRKMLEERMKLKTTKKVA